MKTIKYRLLLIFAALLMHAVSAHAQRYPCFDYGLIEQGLYECKFDLYIGDLEFNDGTIRPEKKLTDKEINDAIDAGLLKHMQTKPGNANVNTTLRNPCLIMDPLNYAVARMHQVLGEDHVDALNDAYMDMVLQFGKDVIGVVILPDRMSWFEHFLSTASTVINISDGVTQEDVISEIQDRVGEAGAAGKAGDGLDLFFSLIQSIRNIEDIKKIMRDNQQTMQKGIDAERELSRIYAKIYEEIKKKMKETEWSMRMLGSRQTIDRMFWNIPVKVDYILEKLDLKKVVKSESFEGMYRGDIVIRIENMQGLDEALPTMLTSVSNIENPIDDLYKILPKRTYTAYKVVVNRPTKYVRRVRFENVTVDVRRGQQNVNLSSRKLDEPEFSLDATLFASAGIDWSIAIAIAKGFFKDAMSLTSSDPNVVKAMQANSSYNWFVTSAWTYSRGTGEGMTGTGGYHYETGMPGNNFLKTLMGGGCVIVHPNDEQERLRNYQSTRR